MKGMKCWQWNRKKKIVEKSKKMGGRERGRERMRVREEKHEG
jgi:hypothetical protein